MKKFHFNLETLLKVRNQKIKKLKGDLSAAHEECILLNSEEEELVQKIGTVEREIEIKRREGNLKDDVMHDHYLHFLRSTLLECQRKKDEKQSELLAKQQTTSNALQERKIVEKLKEKKYSLWQSTNDFES